VVLLSIAGCSELGWFAGGAGSIVGLDHLLGQAEEDIQENIELLDTKTTELEQQLAETEDAAEKARIQAEIDANKKMLDWFQRMLVGIQAARAGKETDWKDPVSALSWFVAAAGLLTAYLKNRQKNKSATALAEVVHGIDIAKKNMGDAPAKKLRDALVVAESTATTVAVNEIRDKIE
jgi:hypothetical protein